MPWLPKQTVLVPVDFSLPASLQAVTTALQLVAKPQDLHVLHVLAPSPPLAFGYGDISGIPESVEQQKVVADQLSRFLQEHNAGGAKQLIRVGDAGLVIADYAKECHADLIVIPSHGYHGAKRLLLGSVAERVLRHAPCSVLVLRVRSQNESWGEL